MRDTTTRRDFLKTSTLAGVGFWVSGREAFSASSSPNEKLNIGIVGAGGRGRSNLNGVSGENIVAICDVDQMRAAGAFKKYPKATRYEDFHKMLEKEAKRLDAVVVSTPDHTHIPASVAAMRRGLHCYCEKPLAHNVAEARLAADVAAEQQVATQLGTQIHAGDNYRRVVEIIQSGAIGPVDEVHVWVSKIWSGGTVPQDTPPVPDHLNWNLWLGPAEKRPYHPAYVPKRWRGWWDFGNGTLGDMACHYMDLPFWALRLRHPETIEAEGPKVHPESAPRGLKVTYRFPAREKLLSDSSALNMPAVNLTWYDGNRTPNELHGQKLPGSGVLFVGSKGKMLAGYSSYTLLPKADFQDYQPPEPTIPRSIGHHREWIRACKTGSKTTCNFDYSGALTEAVLLGSVAFRSGERIEWDPQSLRAKNCPLAEQYIHRQYRDGWAL